MKFRVRFSLRDFWIGYRVSDEWVARVRRRAPWLSEEEAPERSSYHERDRSWIVGLLPCVTLVFKKTVYSKEIG